MRVTQAQRWEALLMATGASCALAQWPGFLDRVENFRAIGRFMSWHSLTWIMRRLCRSSSYRATRRIISWARRRAGGLEVAVLMESLVRSLCDYKASLRPTGMKLGSRCDFRVSLVRWMDRVLLVVTRYRKLYRNDRSATRRTCATVVGRSVIASACERVANVVLFLFPFCVSRWTCWR